jgi:glyoxylase-like metal-dependent hydrolase (beta-lactamase superfamily II)
MLIKTLVVGLLETNCYVIADSQTGEAAIIDPGGDAPQILSAVAQMPGQLQVRYVIDTHAHFDHVLGNSEVMEGLTKRQQQFPELVIHPAAAPLLAADGGARWFGFAPVPSPEPDRFVEEGDTLLLGEFALQVMHTPGHSPGSISLYCAAEGLVLVGDVLFRRGIGRVDLPGGSWDVLSHSIRHRLFPLADGTRVYPGHGMPTTIGEEKRGNPFVRWT